MDAEALLDKRRAILLAAALTLVAIVVGLVLVTRLPGHLEARRHSRALSSVIADLRSEHAAVRSSAAAALADLGAQGLTLEGGLLALESAAASFPVASDSDDGGALLVAAAARHPKDEYAPIVAHHFIGYSPRARFWALRLLADVPDRLLGASTILAILRDHTAACEDLALADALGPMFPNRVRHLFPEILTHLGNERLGMAIAYLAYETVARGSVSREVLEPFAEPLVALYTRKRDVLAPLQRATGHRWMWEQGYLEPRNDAALLLDLFGYVRARRTREALARAGTEYTDPRLLTFALASRLRLKEDVPAESLETIASFAETRNTLYSLLQGVRRTDLFPARYRTQEAFAESAMVRWLVYPTELGQVPDTIELMKVVTTGAPGEERDHYVYRFRMDQPHWAAAKGWMAGVAGPFARREQPTIVAGGETFSAFVAWDSQSPEEHVGKVAELIGEAWKTNAKAAAGVGTE